MTDFMEWLSLYYIKPYADSQPKDDGEETDFSLLKNELLPGLWDALDTVNKWLEATVYAIHDDFVMVHYNGWPSTWDEWIHRVVERSRVDA